MKRTLKYLVGILMVTIGGAIISIQNYEDGINEGKRQAESNS